MTTAEAAPDARAHPGAHHGPGRSPSLVLLVSSRGAYDTLQIRPQLLRRGYRICSQ